MKRRDKIFIFAAILAAVLIGTFLSPLASKYPGGVEKVAEKLGFAGKAASFNIKFLIPYYLFPGIKNSFWQTALPGFIGVLIVLVIFALIFGIISLVNKIKNSKSKTLNNK